MKIVMKLVAAPAAVLCAGGAYAQAGQTVKIAFIDPLSGPFANVGQNQLKAWQFAAERLSGAKNPSGVKFEVMGFDNKGSPQESLNVVKAAIQPDHKEYAQLMGAVPRVPAPGAGSGTNSPSGPSAPTAATGAPARPTWAQ